MSTTTVHVRMYETDSTNLVSTSETATIEIHLKEKHQKLKRSIKGETALIEEKVTRSKSMLFENQFHFFLIQSLCDLNVSYMLSAMNVHPAIQERLKQGISAIVTHAALSREMNGFKSFGISVDLKIVTVELQDEGEEEDEIDVWVLVSSTKGVEKRKILKKERFNGGDSGDRCLVCSNKFLVGLEVIRMPCSHSFHVRCFDRWLD